MSTDGPQTLRWWMDERRGELGLTWQQVADRAGVSTETLYRAAEGRPMRTTTRKGVERALQWEKGTVAAILGGQPPRSSSSHAPDPTSSRDAPVTEESVTLVEEIKTVLAKRGVPMTPRMQAVFLNELEMQAAERQVETKTTEGDRSP